MFLWGFRRDHCVNFAALYQYFPIIRYCRTAVLALSLLATTALALAQETVTPQEVDFKPIPGFAELEATGAIIGEIRINNQDIFDLNDPKEDKYIFRLANSLHIRTRARMLRRYLLFNSGETVSVRLIEETERVMRNNRFLYDVHISPYSYHDGVADIEVKTKDTWSLTPGASFSRAGGTNTSSVGFEEKNFLGTGTVLSYGKLTNVDRTGHEYHISQNNAFGNWENIEYTRGSFDDGRGDKIKLERPFYALDARWAVGIMSESNERIDKQYSAGSVVGSYRHSMISRQAYGGLSQGLINGWVQRYSLGMQLQEDTYQPDPLLPTPSLIPDNRKVVEPFVRYELVEDGFVKVANHDLINHAEYFNMGLTTTIEIGRATSGSTYQGPIYSGSISDGMNLADHQSIFLSGYFSVQEGESGGEKQIFGGTAKFYHKQSRHGMFFVGLSGDKVNEGTNTNQFQLGGDNGLRGYPLRYQSGVQRALLSIEQRGYTDLYIFRLFRVGGAIFSDIGRAWGGVEQNASNPGWLSDVGLGLRLFNDRTASGNVIHIDIAAPLKSGQGVRSYQILIKGKDTF